MSEEVKPFLVLRGRPEIDVQGHLNHARRIIYVNFEPSESRKEALDALFDCELALARCTKRIAADKETEQEEQ